jgi:hypothetical protein
VYRTGARYGLYPIKEECKEENYDVLLRRGKSVSVDMGIRDMLRAWRSANGRRATLLQRGRAYRQAQVGPWPTPHPTPGCFNLIPPKAAARLGGERPEFPQDERGMACSGEEVRRSSRADLKEGEKELTGLRALGRSFRKPPSFQCPHNYL